MAHTPGPWRVGDAGHTVFGPPAGLPPIMVATLENAREGSARDNARLIAAAPELLAVALALVAYDEGGYEGDIVDIVEMAEAAISKARQTTQVRR